jgi:nucleoside-diphosphate-sugar epimerase
MLGGAVARALHERGEEVTVLQRRPAGLGCREVLGDVTDAALVRTAATGCEAVVHLAARVSVTGAWRDYHDVNVCGTAHVLDAARRAGAGRLVHVSSPSVAHSGAALLGVDAQRAQPQAARGHYARSKAMAELLALAGDGPSLAVLAVRPHLVWGPGDTKLVGRIVDRARAGRLALVDDGAALVDTTYVDNAVAAVVAALDRAETARGQALVVSNGEPRPVAEILARLCAAAGVSAPRRRVRFPLARAGGAVIELAWALLHRDGDPPMTRFLAEQLATAHWFDQRRTRAVLGWAPTVSLEQGFARLTAWYAASADDRS